MEYTKLWALLKEPLDELRAGTDAGDSAREGVNIRQASNDNGGGAASSTKANPKAAALDEDILSAAAGPQLRAMRGAAAEKVGQVLELTLSGKRLGDLGDCRGRLPSPLTQYAALRKLNLANNLLCEIHMRTTTDALAELRELSLDSNCITVLPTFTNAKLELLAAAHNRIKQLPPLALPRLATLDLSGNKIATPIAEPLAGLRLPALTRLDLSSNELTSLKPIAGLTHLTSLNISANQLSSLAGIEGMTDLEELVASRNKLRYAALMQHSNPLRTAGRRLAVLDVSFNEISSLAFFPGNGAMGKVWSLNISNNKFLGSNAAASGPDGGDGGGARGVASGRGGGRGGGRAVLRGPAMGAKGSSSIFSSGDIGDAAYDDADAPSHPSATSSSAAQKAKAAGTTAGRGAAAARDGAPAGRNLRSSNSSGGGNKSDRSMAAATLTTSSAPRTAGDGDAAFLQRLSLLFPEVEALDISHNSAEIVPSVGDLRHLSRCSKLTELRVEGTLPSVAGRGSSSSSGGASSASWDHYAAAVRAALPSLEVLDRHPLVERVVLANNDDDDDDEQMLDLECKHVVTAKKSPLSSAARRPGSARAPRAASTASATASSVSMDECREGIVEFIARAELARQRCHRIVDHMQASIAWAYGGAAEPADEPDFAGVGDADASADEDASGDEVDSTDAPDDRLQGVEPSAPGATPTRRAPGDRLSGATPPSIPRGRTQTMSPQTKRIARSASATLATHNSTAATPSSSRSASTTAAASVAGQHRRAAATAAAAVRGSASYAPSSVGSEASSRKGRFAETDAMRRVKAHPSTSFALDHARFRREMQREADERRQRIEAMVRHPLPAPKPVNTLSAASLRGETSARSVAECGTSTTSPAKEETRRGSAGSGNAAASTGMQQPAAGVTKVTTSTSTSTSPAKVGSPPQVPALPLRGATDNRSSSISPEGASSESPAASADGRSDTARSGDAAEVTVGQGRAVCVDATAYDVRTAIAPSGSGSGGGGGVESNAMWQALRPSSATERSAPQTSAAANSARSMTAAGAASLVLQPAAAGTNTTGGAGALTRPGSAGGPLKGSSAAPKLGGNGGRGVLKPDAWEQRRANAAAGSVEPPQPLPQEVKSAMQLREAMERLESVAVVEDGPPHAATSAATTVHQAPTVGDAPPQPAEYFAPVERSLQRANTKRKAGSSLNARR